MPSFFYFGRILAKVLLVMLTRWEVRGKENVPEKGPLVVVCNHLNNADPPILSASLPREIAFMAKEELFRNPFTRMIIAGYGAFKVDRKHFDREALRTAGEVLRREVALGIFPEGSRSTTARLKEALPGSALMALRFNCPVLPVAITGTEKMKGFFWVFRRPRVVITIGPPFQLPVPSGRTDKKGLINATDVIMTGIAELLPESYRGIYGDKTLEQAHA